MQLQNAERKRVKLKINIASPSGFGKTYGSLIIAYGMTGDWTKIGVIDTENESASLYAHLGPFKTISLAPPYTPERYIQAINICEDSGIEVIIIDSITHVWKGKGGLLEYQSSLGGKYQDWIKVTPLYQKWLAAILQSRCHIITTNRKKQGYNMTTDSGKTKVEKVGLEDEIRDGYEYEMTIAFEVINDKHLVRASKDRTGLFTDHPEFVITSETGKKIIAWNNEGAFVTEAINADDELIQLIMDSKTIEELKALYKQQSSFIKTKHSTLFSQKRIQLETLQPDQTTHISKHLKTSTNGIIRN